MEDILKQILSELKELKEGQARLEGKVTSLEGKVDKLSERETEHFNLLFEEQARIFDSFDKRITVIEAKI